MFFSRSLRAIKWLVFLCLIWLVFIGYQIASFPIGNLEDKADVAIVLGAAVSGDKPSPVFEQRIKHAINLYQAGKIKKIIFTGGKGENKLHAESTVARTYAIAKGIPESAVLVETQSLTTKENLLEAKKLFAANSTSSSLIISDSLHTKRAMMIAKDIGMHAVKPSATPTSLYKSTKTRIPFLLRELYFYHHYILFNE